MKPAMFKTIMLLLFDFVIPVYAGYRAFMEYPDGDWLLMASIAGISIVFSFGLMFLFNKQQKEAEKQDPIRQKIQAFREKGQELHLNREEELTEQDIVILKKHNSQTLLIATVVFALLGFAFLLFPEGIIARLLGAGLLVLIFPMRKHLQKEIVRVVQDGKKQVVRGIITERFITTTGRRDSKTKDYWLTLGEIKFKLNKSQYDRYQIGDAAEFHSVDYPKGVELIFRDEKLNQAGLT